MGFKNIAFFYGHSASNIGDLAINYGQVDIFKECFPDAKIHVVFLNAANSQFLSTSKDSFVCKESIEFHFLNTKDYNLVSKIVEDPVYLFSYLGLEDVDAVWVSSGEHLFEYSNKENYHSIFWRTYPLFAAKYINKFAGVLPSTYGPYEDGETKHFVKTFLKSIDFVGVREAASQKLIKKELDFDGAFLGLDPAFFIDTSSYQHDEVTNNVGIIMRSEGWGIRLSKQERKETTQSFKESGYKSSKAYKLSVNLIERLVTDFNKSIKIFVQTNADKELSEAILRSFEGTEAHKEIEIIRPVSVDDYLANLSKIDHIITSRFHAAILGFVLKKRVDAVYFESHGYKMPGLFEFLELPDSCHNLSTLSDEVVSDAIVNAFLKKLDPNETSDKIESLRRELKDRISSLYEFENKEEDCKESESLEELRSLYWVKAIKLIGKEKDKEIESIEFKHDHRVSSLNKSIEKLKEQNYSLSVKVKELKENLTNQTKKRQEMEDNIIRLENKSLKALLKAERSELKRVYSSTSYKVGMQVVKDYQRPLQWPLIPIKLLKMFLQHKKKVERKALSQSKSSRTMKKANGEDNPSVVTPSYINTEKDILKLIKDRKESTTKSNGEIKKICYVLHNSLPYASGGYATRAHGVATGLAKNGFDVVCLTRPGFPLDVRNDIDPGDVQDHVIDGISYQRVRLPLRKGSSNYEYMNSIITPLEEKIKEINPDLVIAASFYLTALPSLIVSRKLNIPFVYEIRGLAEVTKISREPSYRGTDAYNNQVYMEAETANNADHVLTLTEPMKDEMASRGVSPAKIIILPNSANAENFSPRERDLELAKKLKIPVDTPVIGYIGTFVDYEGLEDLVYAAGILKNSGFNFRLLIVGSENVNTINVGPITTMMKKYARDTGLDDWLILPGRVPHEKVESFYSLIDIAPFPRKPWPVCEMVSPMKPLEALAMKKAVVVSSVAALSHMVEDGVTGLVFKKGDVGSLVNTLTRLIEDPQLRGTLGENAREWVKENRSWEFTTKRAMLAIHDAMHGK
ncbi:polysaccharide pyruvyl transferase family protein [Halomonas marinisediminis]|uniref:Glycosyltransferase n=1 Tax=Halomonas marinisediminis TaxID=2546095 RepID=A0ABY2D3P8_9GAMM|nr:polysaccharide pyruvyl transferase family protein [Halomonas marinisediminis]TDA95378.1 glycosyltransferase [Halomonas marinisediminis]